MRPALDGIRCPRIWVIDWRLLQCRQHGTFGKFQERSGSVSQSRRQYQSGGMGWAVIRGGIDLEDNSRRTKHISKKTCCGSIPHVHRRRLHTAYINPEIALIILATDTFSIFEKANHFLPKSFSDAPMWYTSLPPSMIRNRSRLCVNCLTSKSPY